MNELEFLDQAAAYYSAPDFQKDDPYEERYLDDSEEAMELGHKLLEDSQVYHEALHEFREDRERSRNYVNGDQWGDVVDDPDNEGQTTTEENIILNQGRQPIVNNQLKQVMNNMLGQYREHDHKSITKARKREDQQAAEMLTNALHSAADIDETAELDVAMFREFLTSAMVSYKDGVEYHRDRDANEISGEIVNPARIFFNTDVQDIRLKDLRFIGEIIDAPLEDIINSFAETDEDKEKIEEWYGGDNDRRPSYEEQFGPWRFDDQDFYYPINDHLVRMFTVWRIEHRKKVFCHDFAVGKYYQHPINNIREAIDAVTLQNEKRTMQWTAQKTEEAASMGIDITQISEEEREAILQLDVLAETGLIEYEVRGEDVWFYYHLTPWGQILSSGETPYLHQEHPYTLGLYPLMDSTIRSFIQDLIDLQKQINRMLSLQDFIIASSAKGVLMVPEDMIPAGMSPDDFASQWTSANGMLMYVPSKEHKHMPQQVVSNSTNVGAQNLLSVYMNLMKEISGVTEALQGHSPKAGTPSSLYAQMATNATLSTKDLFEFFFNTRKKRDYKRVKLIQQFWNHDRYVNVADKDFDDPSLMYDPLVAADVPVDMVIARTNNSPVYREELDQHLINFWQAGAIDIRMLLKNSSMPFADKLLQQMDEDKGNLQIPNVDPSQEAQIMSMMNTDGKSQRAA